MKYYKHKDKDVICELIGNDLRLRRWKREGIKVIEDYSFKEVTPEFYNSFKEVTQDEFNIVWGNQLQNA